VLKSVADEWQSTRTLVCNGFSQGVAMAFRAAANSPLGVRGVLACGGDIPPELDRSALSKIPAVLLGRGIRDEWYTDQKLEADERRLQDAGVAVEIVRFDGGHEWPPEFARAAGEFLSGLRR
jgi:predicted esterase